MRVFITVLVLIFSFQSWTKADDVSDFDPIGHFSQTIATATIVVDPENDSPTIFCEFNDNEELFVINMQIDKYSNSSRFNHNPKASRKLLLKKNELKSLSKEIKVTGFTIIPIKLFINDKGIAKIIITLAKGKKLYDKRASIKDRENKRNLDRLKKSFKNNN